jgi:hypothetical protein
MSIREPARRRAQGSIVIPYPPGILGDRDSDNCLLALEVIAAHEGPDGAVHPDRTIPRVGWGKARPTLEELVWEAFRDPQLKRDDVHCRVLLFEIESIGEIDPRCPLRLERRIVYDDGQREFIEALILPFGDADAALLAAVLRGPGDAQSRHATAMRYARELEERWAACSPARRLPLRHLREDFPVTRVEDAPAAAPDEDPATPDQDPADGLADELAVTHRPLTADEPTVASGTGAV